MAVSSANLVVGAGGTVHWGTTGITAPTSATAAPGGTYADLGYLDEDGVTVSVTGNIQDFAVWQSRQPGRREALGQDISVSGKFAEWNTNTVPRVFGGGSVALTGAAGTYPFPTDTASLEEFAIVVTVQDSTDYHRFVFGRVNQTESVEVQFNRSNLAVLPFNFAVLAPAAGGSPGTYYTNNIT